MARTPKAADLMTMPNEILLAIIKHHGRHSESDMKSAVARAIKLGVIDKAAVAVRSDPVKDISRQPIADVCRRLRGLFIGTYQKGDLTTLYVPFAEQVELPWKGNWVEKVKKVIITPFGTLDEFYYDKHNQVPREQIGKRKDYTAHDNDDEDYSSEECKSDDDEAEHEAVLNLDGDMTVDEYWAQWELAPSLWPKTIDTILHILPGVELTVHIHHYLQRLWSDPLETGLKSKTLVFYYMWLLAFPNLHLDAIDILSTGSFPRRSWNAGRVEGMLRSGRTLVHLVTQEELETATLAGGRFSALRISSKLVAEAKQHLSKASDR